MVAAIIDPPSQLRSSAGLRGMRPALHRARALAKDKETKADPAPDVVLPSRSSSREYESEASQASTRLASPRSEAGETSPSSGSESTETLRALLLASEKQNAALLRDLEAERARNRAATPEPEDGSSALRPLEQKEPLPPLAQKPRRASSARASTSARGFQALRRLSSSSSNTSCASTMPASGGGWPSLSISRSSSFEKGVAALSRSVEPRRPKRVSAAAAGRKAAELPGAALLPPKPKSRRRTSIMPTKPLRAGALLPSASAPGALLGDDDEAEPPAPGEVEAAAWPEPLISPLKPTAAARGKWGDASRPAAACFSRGLLSRVQEQLAQELARLQEQTNAVLEASLLPADDDEAKAAGAAEEDTSEAGPAALEERVRSLSRRLGWVRSDLSLLSPHVAANGDEARRDELPRLLETALAAEDFASSLRAELRTQAHAREEERYGALLLAEGNLAPAPVAKDGNCLFGCAARWAALRQATAEAADGDGDGGGALVAGAPAEARAAMAGARLQAALEKQGLGSADELREGAAAWREKVVAALREAVDKAGTAEAAAVDAMLGEAHRGGAHDDTSARLRAALRPALDAGKALGTPEARAAYTEVMAQDGVFGARLELETLAALLRAPVHLYYRLPGQPPPALDEATRLPPPSEVIAPPRDADEAAEPLRLLHMMSARHFDLLLPLV